RDLIPAEDFILPDGRQMDIDGYIAEIRCAHKERFFSFDSIVDTFTHCFAAPVYNQSGICSATLCIVAPKDDARENYAQYKNALQAAADKLSKTA
ncbi:MAG TPA: IclR family transcriptional regulator, partial [Thalassospira sp.]|nr:IclR family transcriptional regulator [Thalassospira sp.]